MNERALVVDGDFLMRGFALESLRQAGIVAMEATSVQEARRMVYEQLFDIMFVDLSMIGSSTWKLDGKDSVIVVMAPFRRLEKAIDAVNQGMFDYLVKPFSTEQASIVVSRAREFLALRARIRELEDEVANHNTLFDNTIRENSSCTPSEPCITNLEELERLTIFRVMEETKGHRRLMAERLGISPRTLRNKLSRYREEDWDSIPALVE